MGLWSWAAVESLPSLRVQHSCPKHLYVPASLFVATVRCQGIPRFPNHSVWLSMYFLGKYFIAQSCTDSTDDSSSYSSISTWAELWFSERRRCDFHDQMAVYAYLTLHKSSFLSSVDRFTVRAARPASISSVKILHRSQTSLHGHSEPDTQNPWGRLERTLYNDREL